MAMITIRHEHVLIADPSTKGQLDRIESLLLAVSRKENALMATAQELLQAANDEATVVDSVVALVQSLRDDLKKLPNVPPDVQSAIDATFAKITGDKDKLAAALTENTPVDVADVTAADNP
jgi:predicted metal-dependent enzyme (double-stranded beta helix superfamily)